MAIADVVRAGAGALTLGAFRIHIIRVSLVAPIRAKHVTSIVGVFSARAVDFLFHMGKVKCDVLILTSVLQLLNHFVIRPLEVVKAESCFGVLVI